MFRLFAVACVFGIACTLHGATTKAVLRLDTKAENLLKAAAWRAVDARSSSRQTNGANTNVPPDGESFECDNGSDAKIERGFSQTLALNQTVPLPIIATAESKAENAGGSVNSDYSLYLDMVYTDGESLWGQTSNFKVGTHDWQHVEVKVFPAKPVKTLSFYLLFRRHSGKALFRNPVCYQLKTAEGAGMFDGVPVEFKGASRDGFEVRDVAAGSDYVSFENGEALGLKFEVSSKTEASVTQFTGKLTDTSGKDRAISLIYAVPFGAQATSPLNPAGTEAGATPRGGEGDRSSGQDARTTAGTEAGATPLGWRWLASPRSEMTIEPRREYANVSHWSAGSGMGLSKYPLGAIAKENQGKAIGIDMTVPAFYRIGASGPAKQLFIAYDFGLTPEKPSAEFSFYFFKFNGADGFRGALAQYYAMYPECFRCRTPKQGLWMPFEKISSVQGWEDFGFRFKEGNNETAWDDTHDMITFRYTEPLTWWMTMPKGSPKTMEAAVAEAQRLAAKGDKSAQALLTSGYHDEDGKLMAQLRTEPWCDGAVWSMNSSPGIKGEINDFQNKWNAQLREQLYGAKRKGDLDGEYIDSSEGWVTGDLDFRREHFATARAPLAFSRQSFKPGILRELIAYDYIRAIADDVHGLGKLMMANATPIRVCWLAPWLDVMGTETDWNHSGQWRPMSDEDLLYRRAICGPKPYCFLMNTNFEQFSHELVEKYMKRSLAYGMFPGFFSHNASEGHYFTQPKLYNRDRDLFKKYVPLCRQVAEAGWQPVTGASSNVAKVYVERFGSKFWTVFNDSGGTQQVTLSWREKAPRKCKDLVSGTDLSIVDGQAHVTLQAEDVAVLVDSEQK
ncbi:MAG TPA: hypothetical protein VGP72_24495 [Planctomycetota bacterium]|jgi:hypothetical protein